MSKKVLIVTAHPSSKGFTHAMAQRYESRAVSAGKDVKVLDLYKDEMGLKFTSCEDIKDVGSTTQSIYFQQLLSWADEYVFIFPVWWMEAPAIFKNFFDAGFVAGFAFKYVGNGAEGLLKNKTCKFFLTADAPAWAYFLGLAPLIKPWKMRMNFCGVKVKKFAILGKKRWRNDEFSDKWAAKYLDPAVTM